MFFLAYSLSLFISNNIRIVVNYPFSYLCHLFYSYFYLEFFLAYEFA